MTEHAPAPREHVAVTRVVGVLTHAPDPHACVPKRLHVRFRLHGPRGVLQGTRVGFLLLRGRNRIPTSPPRTERHGLAAPGVDHGMSLNAGFTLVSTSPWRSTSSCRMLSAQSVRMIDPLLMTIFLAVAGISSSKKMSATGTL